MKIIWKLVEIKGYKKKQGQLKSENNFLYQDY